MNNYIKIALQFVFAVIFFCFMELVADEGPRIIYPNGIAAIIENRVITMDDLQRKIGPYLRQLQKESSSQEDFEAKMTALAQEVLDKMIDDILIVNEFNSNKKLKIPNSLLENQYAKFMVEQFQGNRSHYLQYLEENGITDRELKEQQKEQLIIGHKRGLLRKSEAEISPMLINKYYEENKHLFMQKDAVHLRQIVLKADDNDSVLLLEKAQKVMKQLQQGQDFAQVAKQFSEDDMKASGGDWGWMNRSEIREELANVAFLLNKKEFSDIIILNNYAFILFVEDKKTAGTIPIEKVRDDIEKNLVNEHAKQAEAQHIQKLRKKAYIRYYI